MLCHRGVTQSPIMEDIIYLSCLQSTNNNNSNPLWTSVYLISIIDVLKEAICLCKLNHLLYLSWQKNIIQRLTGQESFKTKINYQFLHLIHIWFIDRQVHNPHSVMAKITRAPIIITVTIRLQIIIIQIYLIIDQQSHHGTTQCTVGKHGG